MTVSPVEVLGTIWFDSRPERTPLGRRIEAAKDHGDDAAVALVAADVAHWASQLGSAAEGTLVVGVPASPDRPNRLVPAVARAFAAAWGVEFDDAVVRHRPTVRLRDLAPADRPAVAVEAAYEVVGAVAGREIVLVDDVVFSGATLGHVGELLHAAGAASVRLIAVARARRV